MNKTLKRFMSFVLVLGLIVTVVPSTFAGDDVKVTLNGEYIAFDQPPVIIDGRTLVPIRAVCEALGADVYWRESNQTIWVIKNELKLIFKIGKNSFEKAMTSNYMDFFNYTKNNSTVIELDVPPQIIDDRTLLPIRTVCEELGAVVDWDENSTTVVISCLDDLINNKNTDIYFFEKYEKYSEEIRLANTTGSFDEENTFRKEQSSFRIYLNNTGGYPITFGQYQPIMDKNGNALVPVSSIPNVFQGRISYLVDGETVTIQQNGFEYSTTVKVMIGSKILYKNDVAIEMESVPVIHRDQIYIPMKPVGEAMEHYVDYDERWNQFAIYYTAVDIYVWNENEDSSNSGLRYAIFQGSESERELSEIQSRAVSDFEEIKVQFNRVPPGYIHLCILYRVNGYKVSYEVKDKVENEIIGRFGYVCGVSERPIDDVPLIIQGMGEYSDRWYSEQLAALGEGDIRNNENQTYRFSCFRSFHAPFTIRVDVKTDGTGVLTFSMCEQPIGAYGGEPVKSSTRDLSKEQVNSLVQSVSKNKFWDLPISIDDLGLDGSMWIVEGINNGKYHIVERWTPSSGEIYELGSLFIKLSGEEIISLY